MRAPRRSSKSWARGLFCSGSRKTVSSICTSGASIAFLSSAITFFFLAATIYFAAAWILQPEPMQRAIRCERLMREEASEFLSQTTERDHDQLIRYIYDSERIVIQNISGRSNGVSGTRS